MKSNIETYFNLPPATMYLMLIDIYFWRSSFFIIGIFIFTCVKIIMLISEKNKRTKEKRKEYERIEKFSKFRVFSKLDGISLRLMKYDSSLLSKLPLWLLNLFSLVSNFGFHLNFFLVISLDYWRIREILLICFPCLNKIRQMFFKPNFIFEIFRLLKHLEKSNSSHQTNFLFSIFQFLSSDVWIMKIFKRVIIGK